MLTPKIIVLCVVLFCCGNLMAQKSRSDYFRKTDLKPEPFFAETYEFVPSMFLVGIPQNPKPKEYVHFFYLAQKWWSNSACKKSIIRKHQKRWKKEHTDSHVVEVFRRPKERYIGRDLVLSYVWVISDDENFSIDLVRLGACKAEIMLITDMDEGQILIKKKLYEGFKKRVIAAENQAKKERLGVWGKEPLKKRG